ncbi:hypothetical protein BD311DRAFT_741494 [Dichomitus squalens]|uniref:Uncharacterized protein n=1 Tax=Dichomitus squalens TaxID=114155 RepID=A0A4Q9MGF9_9APHY|nr:hypothetical protein BD311DRAFT_741494 [Dichomitus squalens]
MLVKLDVTASAEGAPSATLIKLVATCSGETVTGRDVVIVVATAAEGTPLATEVRLAVRSSSSLTTAVLVGRGMEVVTVEIASSSTDGALTVTEAKLDVSARLLRGTEVEIDVTAATASTDWLAGMDGIAVVTSAGEGTSVDTVMKLEVTSAGEIVGAEVTLEVASNLSPGMAVDKRSAVADSMGAEETTEVGRGSVAAAAVTTGEELAARTTVVGGAPMVDVRVATSFASTSWNGAARAAAKGPVSHDIQQKRRLTRTMAYEESRKNEVEHVHHLSRGIA